MREDGKFSFLHADHLGSTVAVTEAESVEVQRYLAFGVYRTVGEIETDHEFTGQKQDDTDLLYYGARYYDKKLGTFISPDPLIPDAGNVFAYNRSLFVDGSPLNYNDPTGYAACVDAECHVLWDNLGENFFIGQGASGLKQVALTVVNELGTVDDLGAMAMIVEVAAGLYPDWNDFMAATGDVFIGTSTF